MWPDLKAKKLLGMLKMISNLSNKINWLLESMRKRDQIINCKSSQHCLNFEKKRLKGKWMKIVTMEEKRCFYFHPLASKEVWVMSTIRTIITIIMEWTVEATQERAELNFNPML